MITIQIKIKKIHINFIFFFNFIKNVVEKKNKIFIHLKKKIFFKTIKNKEIKKMSSFGFKSLKRNGGESAAERAQQRAMAVLNGQPLITNPSVMMQKEREREREFQAKSQAAYAEALMAQAEMALKGIPTPQNIQQQKQMQKEQESLRGVPSVKNTIPKANFNGGMTRLNQPAAGEKKPLNRAQLAFQQMQQQTQMQQQNDQQQRQTMMQLMQQQQQQNQQNQIPPQQQQQQKSQTTQSLLRPVSVPTTSVPATTSRFFENNKVVENDNEDQEKYTFLEHRITELEEMNKELMEKVIFLLEAQEKGTTPIAPVGAGKNDSYGEQILELHNTVQGLAQMVHQKTTEGMERELHKKMAQFDSQIKIKFNDMEKRETNTQISSKVMMTELGELKKEIQSNYEKLEENMETLHKETFLAWGKTAYDTCLYPSIPTYDNNVEADHALEAGTVVMVILPPVNNPQTGKWIQTRLLENGEIISKWAPYNTTQKWITFDTTEDDEKDVQVFIDMTLIPYPQDLTLSPKKTENALYDNHQDE